MKSMLAALLLALAFAAAAPAQPTAAADPASAFLGQWEGEAERKDEWPLFLLLQIEQRPDGLGGTLLVLGQRIPLARVEAGGGALTVTTPGTNPIVISGRIEAGYFVGRLRQPPGDFPIRLRAVPPLPRPANRIEAWDQDLETLATRFVAADRSFSPGERALFLERIAEIRRDLPRLDDAEISSRMAAAVALADNGHTRLYLLRNRQELRRLPIRLWWFSDGLYVIRAAAAHKALLGCRVDAIGGRPAREARDLAAPLFAGTSGWKDYKTVYSLTSPETLHGIGIAPDMERIDFRLAGCAAAGSHALTPLPLVRSRAPVEAWWDLSPRYRAPGLDWRHILDGKSLPLYLRSEANYWFEHQAGSGILYFQYNRSEQAAEETTEAFGKRLLAEIERVKPRAFVLDLRFNTGGNLRYAEALMTELVARTEGLRRFVITGRATFSAGMSAAVPWRRPGVVFVGETIGERLDYWSEGGNIPLPNSGYDAHFANGFHSYSPGACPAGVWCMDRNIDSLDPHLPATPSFADYRAGRDPAMAAVISALAGTERPAR